MNTFVLVAAISLAAIFEFGNTTPVHPTEDKAALKLNEQTEKPKPPVETIKAPADYDMQRVAANAAAKVYGWLPADKQPKKIKDQEAPKDVPKPPPADYDVERVAAKAAQAVYGWLPKEQQPKLMNDDERASHVPSALN